MIFTATFDVEGVLYCLRDMTQRRSLIGERPFATYMFCYGNSDPIPGINWNPDCAEYYYIYCGY